MFMIGYLFAYIQRFAKMRTAFPVFLYSAYYPLLFMLVSTIGSAIIRLVFFTIFVVIIYILVEQRRAKSHCGISKEPLRDQLNP